MNEPIISPWIIYAIDVCNSISAAAIFFSLLGAFAIVFVSIYIIAGDNAFVDFIRYKKLLKRLTIFTTAFVIVAIIVPDKRVGYAMLATQYVTKENVLNAVDITEKIVNKIIQIKGDNTADYSNKEKAK